MSCHVSVMSCDDGWLDGWHISCLSFLLLSCHVHYVQPTDATSCDPLSNFSPLNSSSLPIYPCGLIANSVFNGKTYAHTHAHVMMWWMWYIHLVCRHSYWCMYIIHSHVAVVLCLCFLDTLDGFLIPANSSSLLLGYGGWDSRNPASGNNNEDTHENKSRSRLVASTWTWAWCILLLRYQWHRQQPYATVTAILNSMHISLSATLSPHLIVIWYHMPWYM